MFIILDGTAEVISPDGSVTYANLSLNSFFGEVSVFYDVVRTATVRTKVPTTVLELTKGSLRNVLEEHPELRDTIMTMAKENYEHYKKRQSAIDPILRKNTEEFEVGSILERIKKVFKLF